MFSYENYFQQLKIAVASVTGEPGAAGDQVQLEDFLFTVAKLKFEICPDWAAEQTNPQDISYTRAEAWTTPGGLKLFKAYQFFHSGADINPTIQVDYLTPVPMKNFYAWLEALQRAARTVNTIRTLLVGFGRFGWTLDNLITTFEKVIKETDRGVLTDFQKVRQSNLGMHYHALGHPLGPWSTDLRITARLCTSYIQTWGFPGASGQGNPAGK